MLTILVLGKYVIKWQMKWEKTDLGNNDNIDIVVSKFRNAMNCTVL